MGLPMLVGTHSCHQEVSIIQSYSCNRKYLCLFLALVGLHFPIFTFSSHSKALACVQHWKTEVVTQRKELCKVGQANGE